MTHKSNPDIPMLMWKIYKFIEEDKIFKAEDLLRDALKQAKAEERSRCVGILEEFEQRAKEYREGHNKTPGYHNSYAEGYDDGYIEFFTNAIQAIKESKDE